MIPACRRVMRCWASRPRSFRAHKCHYCDFYSLVDQYDRIDPFSSRLLEELMYIPANTTFDTIFFGGGTPPAWLIFGPSGRKFCWVNSRAPHYEWTVEANPETIKLTWPNLGSGWSQSVSLGVQSL